MGRLDWRWLVVIGAFAVAAGALLALLTGAGGDELGEGTAPEQTARGTGAAAATSRPSSPAGTITATAAAEVTVGMTGAEVLERFTPPDERAGVNLGAGGAAPQENWTWHLAGGDFTVYFDTATGEVAGFIASTPVLETPTGARVGEPFGPIQEEFSAELRLSPIGDGNYVLSAGTPGSYPALTFGVQEGTVLQLIGGYPGPAGE